MAGKANIAEYLSKGTKQYQQLSVHYIDTKNNKDSEKKVLGKYKDKKKYKEVAISHLSKKGKCYIRSVSHKKRCCRRHFAGIVCRVLVIWVLKWDQTMAGAWNISTTDEYEEPEERLICLAGLGTDSTVSDAPK